MLQNIKSSLSNCFTGWFCKVVSGLLICLMGLYACQGTPRGVIAIDDMKVLIVEKLMAEEFYNNYLYRDTIIDKDSARSALYLQVLQMHGTDSTGFYKSFQYYRSDPLLFKVLMDSATAYANREREKRYAAPVVDTTTTP